MGVNWAAGLMRWRPHVDRHGNSHTLAHLHPFKFELELAAINGKPARAVTIHVGFALHVFTCKVEHAEPDSDEYGDDREVRMFDKRRYDASFKVEALIRELETRKCFFAKNENFFTVDLDGVPAGHEYRVFFVVRRKDTDAVELVVQSAYFGRIEQRPKGQRKKPVGFRKIVGAVILGKKLKEAP